VEPVQVVADGAVSTDYEATLAMARSEAGESAGMYQQAVRWCVLAAVFLAPLFVLPWTTNPLEMNKQLLLVVAAGAGLILWLLSIVSSGRLSWRSNSIDKGILALAVAAGLATAFSLTPFKSLFGMSVSSSNSLISISALAVIFYLAVNSYHDKGKQILTCLKISVLIALAYGFSQMMSWYLVSNGIANSRAFNTVGSINALGAMAAIILPLFAMKIESKISGYLNALGLLLALAILVVLNWWVLWAIAIAGMVATIGFENLRQLKFKMSRFILPMTVIVIAVFLMIVNFSVDALKKNYPVEVAPSYALSADVASGVLKERLILGYGPENFSLAFDKFGAGRLADTTLSNIRFFDGTSEFFSWVIHGGLVAVAAVAFLFWSLISAVIKKRTAISDDDSGMTVAILSAMTASSAAFFLYPFNTALNLVFFALLSLTALTLWGNARQTHNIEEKAWLSLVASLGFISGLIVVLAGAYFMLSNYISDVRYAQAFSASTNQNAADLLGEAFNWNGKDDRLLRALSQVELGLLSQELNAKADPKDDQKSNRVQQHLANAVQYAQQAANLSPREASNWSNLGGVYQSLIGLVDGVDKLAEDSYLKAEELRPNDASVFNSIGSVYLVKANFSLQMAQSGGENTAKFRQDAADALTKAEMYYKKAIEISSNYGLAIYNLGVVYDREGKLNEAIKQLEKIAPFNSDQPSLAFELGLLYYRAGQKDKSLAQMQRAVVLSPEFANARWYLALIYEERQDMPAAIEQLERILSNEANKDNETVKQKLAQLKSGQPAVPGKVTDQKPL